jgi:hypothetical protein
MRVIPLVHSACLDRKTSYSTGVEMSSFFSSEPFDGMRRVVVSLGLIAVILGAALPGVSDSTRGLLIALGVLVVVVGYFLRRLPFGPKLENILNNPTPPKR